MGGLSDKPWADYELDLLRTIRTFLPTATVIKLFSALGIERSKDAFNGKSKHLGIQFTVTDIDKAIEELSKNNSLPKNIRVKAVEFLRGDFDGTPLNTSSEISILRKKLKTLEKSIEDGSYLGQLSNTLFDRPLPVPDWVANIPARKSGKVGVPQLLLSDWHFGEVVDPDAVWGVNTYNATVAKKRLHRVASAATDMLKNYLSGWRYDGIVIPMAGDMLSGKIHAELERTNEDEIVDAVLSWSGEIARFLTVLADTFGKVYSPMVVGNHGREDAKPISKHAVARNYDYLLYRLVERELKHDSRITIDVSLATSRMYTVFGQAYHLMHGDDFKGGSGIAGMWSPLKLGEHRTARQFSDIGPEFGQQCLVLGHFHQRMTDNGLIVNGSGIGYNEYAFRKHYRFQRPQQAAWLTTPENGQTLEFAVFCDSHKEYETAMTKAKQFIRGTR
jgi:hypothetical protein